VRIPGLTKRTIRRRPEATRPIIILSNLALKKPQILKLKPAPLRKSLIPLPIFGFCKYGFSFGSS